MCLLPLSDYWRDRLSENAVTQSHFTSQLCAAAVKTLSLAHFAAEQATRPPRPTPSPLAEVTFSNLTTNTALHSTLAKR